MIRRPATLGKTMDEIEDTDPVDYVPAAWQCRKCVNRESLCDFNFRRMPIMNSHTFLPLIIMYCTERKV